MTHLSDSQIPQKQALGRRRVSCKCNSAKWHSPDCRLYRSSQAEEFGAGNEIRHLDGSTGVVVDVCRDVVVARYYDRTTGELSETQVNTPVWDLTHNFSEE